MTVLAGSVVDSDSHGRRCTVYACCGPFTRRMVRSTSTLRPDLSLPMRIWVADVRSPDFAAEAHRQAAAVAASDHAADDQAFIDAISVDDK